MLTPDDLVMVVLVRNDDRQAAMPTATVAELGAIARKIRALGVPAVKLFASGGRRDELGTASLAPDGVMSHAVHKIRSAEPDVLVMTETCLCSHTLTGDCHPRDSHGRPDLRAAIEQISAQAVVQADAGANVVGPASMIPGSVRAVRHALDETGHDQVQIMPHLIWRSCLYQEFRQTMEAMPSGGQRPFHLRPGDPVAGMRSALAMLGEGADSLLLEPALTCADLLIQLHSVHPEVSLVPFSVSGEYRRLTRSAELGPLVELLIMLKRAGAERITTYAAVEIAATLL
ncbi:MAG: hypothetical protein ACRDRX_15360 [Pseudonocardiaceae bacterium]